MNECITGAGYLDKDGYKYITKQGKNIKLHRQAYVAAHNLTFKDIEGKVVRHLCHNKVCVNPAHLVIGTPQDNTTDSVEASRHAFGVRHGKAKLTEDAVRHIRQKLLEHTEYAVLYGVSVAAVSLVQNKRTWKHIK